MVDCITDRNIILLVTSVSSGRTLSIARECIEYYGGRLVGISVLFLASPQLAEHDIHPLFTSEDVPDYKLFSPGKCEMCKAGHKLEAIATSEGYTIINH
jgi:orotate phosphoribosyltransferase